MTVTQTVVREFEVDLVVREAEQVGAGRRGDDARPGRTARRCPTGHPAHTSTWSSRDDLDPSVLAVRSDQRDRRLAGRGPQGARTVAAGPQAVHELGAGVDGPRPWTAQPLPGGGRQAVPVRRRRDRHHAAAGDDLRGRGGRRRRGSCTTAAARGRRWRSSTSSSEFGDRVHVVPEDELGRLDLDAILGEPRSDTLVYTCGPEPLLAAVEERCAALAAGSLHLERFTAAGDRGARRGELVRAGAAALRQDAARSRRTGRCSTWSVRPGSACSARASRASAAPARPRSSTATSTTATRSSTTRSAPSNEVMMICVSRCRSARLTLDL